MVRNNFISRMLAALSWPDSIKRSKKYIEPESFWEIFWTGLSFSWSSKDEIFVVRRIDPRLMIKIGRLWDGVQLNMRQGRLGTAEKSLWKLIELDSKNAAAYNRLGIIRAKQAKIVESIEMFKRAAKLESSSAAYHNIGLAYYQLGDYRMSERYFRKSLKLDGGLAARHVALAKVYEKQKKETQMFRELIKATELDPSPNVLRLLEEAYKARGMTQEAVLIRDEVKRKKDDKPSHASGRSRELSQLTLSYE